MNEKVLQSKQAVVKEVVEASKNAASITVVEYQGLTVAQLSELRRNLKASRASLIVYKNSLFERAVEELGYDVKVKEILVGPNAFVFSEDPIEGPKIVSKFARANDKLRVKGGIIEGTVVDAQTVNVIAKLPGRDGIISMFLSVLQAPIRQFAATVKAVADAGTN
ncbi:MAG: 50S ribosomal protein L10 [Bacilli bacterium]|jgi:large subunit ribosomal protein L10|nr:50S ribosomal protein L10 [Bacilli bacterium]MDD3388945.1 50S ribosomal protein L10 [Bacilli bacterium]MDD4344384.1 50S ribosomal protein L10 [Bacilli bacterium]MDD4520712.1 50S ribosomal protein L10 [Bacilli bacterium]MDY0399313.1 50S ribosomal protein L10 [Bacilli bacterium]